MATSLDKQLDRLEKVDAAAAKVHCVQVGRDESREQALARYEAACGPVGDGDLVVFVNGYPFSADEPSIAKPRIIAVRRKRTKPPTLAAPKPRQWGGTTCPQPPPEHADGKRDPYNWRALDKRKLVYPDYFPSPDAGAADDRALRRHAVTTADRIHSADARYIARWGRPISR